MRNRIFSLLLVFVMLFSAVACNGGAGNGDNGAAQKNSPFEFSADNTYSIVYGEESGKESKIEAAIYYLNKVLVQTCGINSTQFSDAEEAEGEYHILVGETNREESKKLLKSVKSKDYTYSVVSSDTIVICGGSAAATYEAVKRFCSDVLGYSDSKPDDIKEISAEIGTSYFHEGTYTYSKATLDGVDLADSAVAYKSSEHKGYAEEIAEKLSEYSGAVIPVRQLKNLSGDEELIIGVGMYGRNGLGTFSHEADGYILKKVEETKGKFIGIVANEAVEYKNAVKAFFDSMTVEKEDDGEIAFAFPENPVVHLNGVRDWYKTSEKTETLCDGVTYTELVYKDSKDSTHKVYALKIDPKKAYIYMGSANDSYSIFPARTATVADQMKAAAANGINAIAGVNGDFFAIHEDNDPTGVAIKEGQLISKGWARPYFGFTYDGKALAGTIITDTIIHSSNIRTAVGGSNMIVNAGLPYNLDIGDAFSDTAHPRTLSGICADGSILLVVVDGRSSKSRGASLAECSTLMISLGAKQAVNHDGGGSSSMVVNNNGVYQTKNSPSDGSLRKVYNSLLVVPIE